MGRTEWLQLFASCGVAMDKRHQEALASHHLSAEKGSFLMCEMRQRNCTTTDLTA
jgi:hypothetical protein